MTTIDTESIAELVPLVIGVALVGAAVYNYLRGVYGAAFVTGIGAMVTLALAILSAR
ncbi:hypothetical protein [Halopiger thermotolerans]